ncbi:MAG: hypothetical protein HON90_10875 [Halobacteriovoraceae bacterium]|jgi:glucoamylase|nr:hypothetical protein [Halobacteriovoraceae bacterium]
MNKFFLLCTLIFSIGNAQSSDWFEAQKEKSLNFLLENISRNDTPKGFIVASPSKTDPNYYYHWVRDAALVMQAIDKTIDFGSKKQELFNNYISLVNHHQTIFSLTGLGEPKYNADGTSFTGPWGRPQNDGPALRSIALIKYAFKLIENGQLDFVREKLYHSSLPANSVIKRDLEYVAANWKNHDFDLWEEVKGHHFYTRMAQRTAMRLGAKLAMKLNDAHASNWYFHQATLIDSELENHWSSNRGYIATTLDRVGGLDYKHENLDASVILAVNHSWIPGQNYGPADSKVIATFEALVRRFKEVYPINNSFTGAAIGRYPEDRYYGGNPWFLLTNAMAEYLFKLDRVLAGKSLIQLDNNNRLFYTRILGKSLSKKSKLSYIEVGQARKMIRMEANAFIKRVKTHMGPSGRMDEQLDKYSGHMLGARDLTWSYASFITIK